MVCSSMRRRFLVFSVILLLVVGVLCSGCGVQSSGQVEEHRFLGVEGISVVGKNDETELTITSQGNRHSHTVAGEAFASRSVVMKDGSLVVVMECDTQQHAIGYVVRCFGGRCEDVYRWVIGGETGYDQLEEGMILARCVSQYSEFSDKGDEGLVSVMVNALDGDIRMVEE